MHFTHPFQHTFTIPYATNRSGGVPNNIKSNNGKVETGESETLSPLPPQTLPVRSIQTLKSDILPHILKQLLYKTPTKIIGKCINDGQYKKQKKRENDKTKTYNAVSPILQKPYALTSTTPTQANERQQKSIPRK